MVFHKRITFGIMSPDNGPLLVAGIVSDNDHSLIYPPFDPSDVSARAARYREMGAPGTFMTGDVFDQVVDTIETHVCVRVFRLRLYSTVITYLLAALCRLKPGVAPLLMPFCFVLQLW